MDQHIQFAVDLARQAGTIIRSNFKLGMAKQWKGDGTPLTAADTAVNRLVEAAVAKQYPGYGLIAEESEDHQPTAEYVWVCDPIDGTIPFSHGIATAVFMLALLKQGQPIIGVVYDPFTDRLFTGVQGKGAMLNGQPIRVNQQNTLSKAMVGSGWWNDPRFIPEVFQKFVAQGADLIAISSIGYVAMLVAAGDFTAAVYGWNCPWDAAALKILVEEAGGRVTDLNGQQQRYDRPINGALISNGLVHDALLAIIH